MKLKYVAIFLVLLCCLMGAASAADDTSADVVDASADDAVVVNAVSQDESDSIESNVVEQDEVVADSASDSDILKDSEIYDGVFRNTMSDDELPDWIKNHVSIVPVFYHPAPMVPVLLMI